MRRLLTKYRYELLLGFFVAAYILYFSIFTILRFQKLYAHYFDLGIMHQTVFNTFEGLKTGDLSRILEMTNPHGGGEQVKRMFIHNDIILALLAPFYFLYSGPETLLVLQTIILGLGAVAVYKISEKVLKNKLLALVFSTAYLLYTPMQRTNNFEFHPVALVTTLLLFMHYFWLTKKYAASLMFLLLSLITKEQVGFVTFLYGLYTLWLTIKSESHSGKRGTSVSRIIQRLRFWTSPDDYRDPEEHRGQNDNGENQEFTKAIFYSFSVIILSLFWSVLSVFVIIPFFRGSAHFASQRYSGFGNSPMDIIMGILTNPYSILSHFLSTDALRYYWFLLGPLVFLSIFSPFWLLVAGPEFAINLLSNDGNMKNIVFHYTAVIQPFVFISAIYGAKKILSVKYPSFVLDLKSELLKGKQISKKVHQIRLSNLAILILVTTLLFSYFKSPLPYSQEKDIYPFIAKRKEKIAVTYWKEKLSDSRIKVSTTGHIAPFFTSRQYFYHFSIDYVYADYVVILESDLKNKFQKELVAEGYAKLVVDSKFIKIFDQQGVEVYKRYNF